MEGYDITWSDSGGYVNSASVRRGTTAYLIGGLANARAYSVKVHAYNTNDLNRVSYSAAISGTATPSAVPSAPTGLVLAPADGQIRVSWRAASHSSAAPVKGYNINWYTGTGAGQQSSALVLRGYTTYTIKGLTNGRAYSVFVRAVNGAGKSAYIWGKATPRATTTTTTTLPEADESVPTVRTIPDYDRGKYFLLLRTMEAKVSRPGCRLWVLWERSSRDVHVWICKIYGN